MTGRGLQRRRLARLAGGAVAGSLGQWCRGSPVPHYDVVCWLRTALPPFGVSVFSVVQSVILLMGFVMGVFATAFAPRIGTFHVSGDHAGLQRQLAGLAPTSFALGTPMGFVLLAGGEWLLALFGPGFATGTTALAILVVGQLVNVFCGAVEAVLTMTGNDHVALPGMILVGPAVATATGMTAANVALGSAGAAGSIPLSSR